MLFHSNAMTSTTSNIAFGNAYSSVQANNINGSVNIGLENTLDRLPHAEDAPFNSYARQNEHECLANTRVNLLQEIYTWADGQDEQGIFWLSGLAGTGKSTIARTVAGKYHANQRLAASFFFSRGRASVSHAGLFVTSIAVQLADNVPVSRHYIRDAIVERRTIATQSLCDQWQHLILRPLSKLREAGSYIIVVDALDECDNDSDIRIIVQLLAEVRPSLPGVRLRVLLTSRPEVPIRHGFGHMADSMHKDVVLHNLSPSVVDHDIGIFLEHWLRIIAKDCYYAGDWPGVETIRKLVQSACGLFIWAATARRFIQEGGGPFADERLRMILKDSAVTDSLSKDSSSSEDSGADDQLEILPEKRLDSIYLTVLQRPVRRYKKYERKKWYALMKEILGAVVLLYSPLSATSLAQLLLIPTEQVYQTLDELHSILDVPQRPTEHVRLHHPSFRDFLLNKDRCRDANLWVDQSQAHAAIADKCIQLLSSSLTQDICGVGDSAARAARMEREQLDHCILPETQYACLYWTSHIAKSGVQLCDNDKVHKFLKKHFLHWLEALSWMGNVSKGICALRSLKSIAPATDCPTLYAFIHDMERFALYCQFSIEVAPLQVYSSALLFAPVKSMVKKQFADKLTQWIKSPPQVDNDWSVCLQTLEGYNSGVDSVVFSHDSTRLASASFDSRAKIWDVRSGECLQTFKTYEHLVVFSHDLTRWASAFRKTVKIWDINNSACLHTLEGHNYTVKLVAFSHDSTRLASASHEGIIKIWDADSGVCLYTSEIRSDDFSPTIFSHDLMQLASEHGSIRKPNITIWDTSSGTCLQTLDTNYGRNSSTAFSRNFPWFASRASSHEIKIWDIDSGACLHTIQHHHNDVYSIAFSHDSMRLASASEDGIVKIWDTSNGVCLKTYKGHSNSVNSVAFSQNSTLLASASQDETIKIWDASSNASLQTHEDHKDDVSSVTFLPDLVQKALDTEYCTCMEANKYRYYKIRYSEGKRVYTHGLTWMAGGKSNGTIEITDRETCTRLKTLKGHRSSVRLLALSHDSTRLASASQCQTIKIWNTSSWECLQTLICYTIRNPPKSLAFSHDLMLLAAGFANGEVKIREISSGAYLQQLYGHNNRVRQVVFSNDSMRLASFSVDKIIIWDFNSGMRLQIIRTCTLPNVTEVFALPHSKETVTLQQVTDCSINVSSDNTWILCNGQELLWLPVEYRPGHFVFSDGSIAVTTFSGRTWTCHFARDFLDTFMSTS